MNLYDIFLLPVLLLILYTIGIQYERGGLWKIFFIFLIPTWFLDVFVNVFIISIIALDMPFKFSPWINKTEYTVSDRLERFCVEETPRKKLSLLIGKLLNKIAPSKVHIRNAR